MLPYPPKQANEGPVDRREDRCLEEQLFSQEQPAVGDMSVRERTPAAGVGTCGSCGWTMLFKVGPASRNQPRVGIANGKVLDELRLP